MGELMAFKERHKRRRKGGETGIKGVQRRLPTEGIADEDCQKINHLILSKARPPKAYLCLDAIEQSERFQNLRDHCYFSEPTRQARCGLG